MATVKRLGNLTVMKFNTIEKCEISIGDDEDNIVVLMDKDCKFLHKLLGKWLSDNGEKV